MQGASRESLGALRDRLGHAVARADTATVQRLSDDLFAVVTLLATQGSLRRALSDPALPAGHKRHVVDTLLRDRIAAPAFDLVREAAGSRWSEPQDVVDAVENLAVESALIRAEADGELDEVEDELFRFERILSGEPDLRAALTNRRLPADAKRGLLHRLLDGKVADVTYALVERAVVVPRGRTVERVIQGFSELAAQRRERLLARVTSAVPLDSGQQEALVAALRDGYGRDVRLQVVVDASLVGGLTVRIGDELIDGSVVRQLDEARRRLTGRSSRF